MIAPQFWPECDELREWIATIAPSPHPVRSGAYFGLGAEQRAIPYTPPRTPRSPRAHPPPIVAPLPTFVSHAIAPRATLPRPLAPGVRRCVFAVVNPWGYYRCAHGVAPHSAYCAAHDPTGTTWGFARLERITVE